MTDLSRIIDFSGSTIVCNDVQVGTGTTGGLEAVSGDTSLVSTTITNNPGARVTIKGVNCNVATNDNAIVIPLITGATTYVVTNCYVWGASGALTANSATAGLFSAVSGGGTAICADQALTPTSGTADTNANMQALTLAAAAANTCFTTATTLYFRTGTKTNAARTCNVTVEVSYLA